MNKVILHVDMDAFFASVEQRDHPELRGKPVIVGGAAEARGVVAAASYEAREFGIHSAMPSAEARRRCPHAIFISRDMANYAAVSREIFAIFERFTPFVEKLSIDEAFLDVSGALKLFGDKVEIAEKIRQTIKTELQLTASVGVAPNKFLAKLASDMNKPDGLTVVPFDEAEIIKFLAPLPVERIWGVGAVTAKNLRRIGISTVADLQKADIRQLVGIVGEHSANHLKLLSLGIDRREMVTEHKDKSISKETTFARDVTDRRQLEKVLIKLVDEVAASLRQKGWYAKTARLKLRWQGFKTITRQRQLNPPCCDTFTLQEEALFLLRRETLDQPVRLIGFGAAGLTRQRSEQMTLFDNTSDDKSRLENLSRSVDVLRHKFGSDAVTPAALHDKQQ